jgi:hypothetical protein
MSTTIAVRSEKDAKGADAIGLIGPTVSICLIVACAVLFNGFPQKVGYYRTIVDPASFVALLGPGFAAFLPWLNLWWALAFSLEVVHLALGHWTTATRWSRLVLDVACAMILVAMAAGEAFVQVPVATVAARFALAVTSFALLIGALAQFVRLLKRLVEGA